MVEVPLEIEAELPREFDGAALLAASGLPRKVKIKAAKDSLKLPTAYRADQLVGDIVKSSMRGTQGDVQRVQEAVNRFVRTVRERRQEGATLVVNSNGRGKIDVVEQMPGSARAAISTIGPSDGARPSPDRAALEKRGSELESAFARLAGGGHPAGGTGADAGAAEGDAGAALGRGGRGRRGRPGLRQGGSDHQGGGGNPQEHRRGSLRRGPAARAAGHCGGRPLPGAFRYRAGRQGGRAVGGSGASRRALRRHYAAAARGVG